MSDSQKNSSIEFPCEFPIKIMGKASLEFQALALSIVRKHAPDLSEGAVQTRYSKDNKYISLTVTINAASQEQLDAIYRELSTNQQVLVAL